MNVKITKLEKKTDERGWLAEILKNESVKRKEFGQIYITTANSGFVKGNHYQMRKTEWFCVITGKALLLLKEKKTGKTQEIELDGSELKIVEIPPDVIHAIKNIGKDEMHLLAYIDESFDPKDPDTFMEKIL
jgi:UDP-2-acetamido-2,6-beta-L-arabino-hexul-4-ose reductase